MPTYEYLCTECGDRKEVVQSFTEDSLTICELCAGKLRKVIYPVGIQFKGSGFYSTDRRASHPMPRTKQDKDGKDGKESKSDSKESTGDSSSGSNSESKSEPKSGSGKSESGSNNSGSPKKAAEKSA